MITLIPMIFVLIVTIWAMIKNLLYFLSREDLVLVIMSLIILVLTTWLLYGGINALLKQGRKV